MAHSNRADGRTLGGGDPLETFLGGQTTGIEVGVSA